MELQVFPLTLGGFQSLWGNDLILDSIYYPIIRLTGEEGNVYGTWTWFV